MKATQLGRIKMRPHPTPPPSSALSLGTPDSQARKTCNLMINHLQKGFLQQSVLITGQFFVHKQVKSGASLSESLFDKTSFSIQCLFFGKITAPRPRLELTFSSPVFQNSFRDPEHAQEPQDDNGILHLESQPVLGAPRRPYLPRRGRR